MEKTYAREISLLENSIIFPVKEEEYIFIIILLSRNKFFI
jgi:hypothetical protein